MILLFNGSIIRFHVMLSLYKIWYCFDIQMNVLLLIMVEVLLTISNFSQRRETERRLNAHIYTRKDHLNKYEQMSTSTSTYTNNHRRTHARTLLLYVFTSIHRYGKQYSHRFVPFFCYSMCTSFGIRFKVMLCYQFVWALFFIGSGCKQRTRASISHTNTCANRKLFPFIYVTHIAPHRVPCRVVTKPFSLNFHWNNSNDG